MYFPCLSLTVHEQAIDTKQLTVISHACLKDGVKHSDGLSHTCIEDIASIANMQSPPEVAVSWYHPTILNIFTNLNYCGYILWLCTWTFCQLLFDYCHSLANSSHVWWV